MARFVPLNNVDHADLKVLNHYFSDAGDDSAAVLTFPTEFANVEKEYPILLSRHSETGQFRAVALLGLKKNENLFLDMHANGSAGWLGRYVPAIVARGPFMLGAQSQNDSEDAFAVYVDLDHPKVSNAEGVNLFLTHGGNSPYLTYVTEVLSTIQKGEEVGNRMFKELGEVGLIEPLTVNIELKNGDKYQLAGYYTINEQKLSTLDGASLEKLNHMGYLQGAFLMISSLTNLQKLIDIKNSRL